MTNLTLKQLRYFEALARHGHFGRAADDCAITQPALSMQIKELEESLGNPLFERAPRAIRLTRFGTLFAERARKILREVEELEDLARMAGDRLSGALRLGVIPTVAPYLLPRIIAKLGVSHPEIDLHLRETTTPKLLQELGEGKLDAAIIALPVSEPTLTETPLFRENFVLVRPEADRGRPVPTPDNLRKMRLLLLEEGHCFRDQALSFCDMSDHHPREMLDGSSLATLVQMVGAGIGVTLIPEMAVPVETRSAAVAVSQFSEPRPSRLIGMVWRKTTPLAPQLASICETVRQATTPLPNTAA
ncbi:hydrogen peroxide-inducible genes activator [Paracoccus aminophilus]|uniref:Hydrogen peroxide sensing transcriptional regulator protein n=1 Tax=Paracoccus aminophilus JCM 7686 TaxID=1367847 RepID=S5Y2D7_PARAH|nr:hydrogen peroxide-inducible genes activator [Paracoccus aminophilus]AGT09915.1 hydrogen peroxide sensing transcriptional regulator protein [Paracoccus aminophilus JCM 7686]